MIHSLRQYHRRTFIALGLLLPVAFAVGIAVRKPVPVMPAASPSLAGPSQFNVTIWDRPGLFAKSQVRTRLLRASIGGKNLAITFTAAPDFIKPDLLVYCVPGSVTVTDALPDNAILVGRFNTPILPLPEIVAQTNGVFLLYSLADNEIVDFSQSLSFHDSAR